MEQSLVQPQFVLDYPAALCPLTRRHPDNPDLALRFEGFAMGMEIANAYTELNDPEIQRSNFDQSLAGEGEETMSEVAEAIFKKGDFSGIKGITYREGLNIQKNPERELIADIDSIPFPALHLMPMDSYQPGALFSQGVKGRSYAKIITSRGCPSRCVFCSSSSFWRLSS